MDTRKKIVSPAEAAAAAQERRAAGERVKLIAGFFDPLLAAHARRLAELPAPRSAVFVALSDPPNPILPVRARAELAAALAGVDYVFSSGDNAALEALRADEFYDERPADARRSETLILHVHSRNKS